MVNKGYIGGEPAVFLNDGTIAVIHGGSVYEMWFGKMTDSKIKNQILSTFQFTK